MQTKLADKIYKEIEDEWVKRHGEKNVDPKALKGIKLLLTNLPDKDEFKRVTSMTTGKTHLVPIKEIILNGIKEEEISKYQEA